MINSVINSVHPYLPTRDDQHNCRMDEPDTPDRPGWSLLSQGLIYGTARHRLGTALQTMALVTPDQLAQLKQPDPPASHDHEATPGPDPCSCQSIWLSGTMPPDGRLPGRPGVYICFDSESEPAYIGTSQTNVRGRLWAHYRDPDKPVLADWLGFWPSEFCDSAAIWEIRLIEWCQPYMNRQYVRTRPEVAWSPQGQEAVAARGPWWARDENYLRFIEGPGGLLDLSDREPWQIIGALRNLLERGCTWADIDQACLITAEREETHGLTLEYGSALSYMAGVARNRSAER